MAISFLNYINGELIPSSANSIFPRLSPWDGNHKASITQSEPMDFVLALNQTKKVQAEYAALDPNARLSLAENFQRVFLSKRTQFLSLEREWGHLSVEAASQVAFEAGHKIISHMIAEYRQGLSSNVLVAPVGIIGVVCPSLSGFTESCRVIISTLLSGNALMMKLSSESAHQVEFWSALFKEASVPASLIQIFQGNDINFEKFLLNHPSLRSVRWTGSSQQSLDILTQVVQFQKNFQLATYSKNAAVLLEDPSDNESYQRFFDQIILGMGQLQSSVHRIFILESFAPRFWEQLSEYMKAMKPSSSPEDVNPWTPLNSYELQKKYSTLLDEVRAEHGKTWIPLAPLPEGSSFVAPVFIQDLPNCSEKHQVDLGLPVFTVTTVKYVHEIGRWANNSYLPRYLWIFGEVEKAKRLAEKLEYSHISINTWDIELNSIVGLKQCFYGDRDENPMGSFWSYVKKLTLP